MIRIRKLANQTLAQGYLSENDFEWLTRFAEFMKVGKDVPKRTNPPSLLPSEFTEVLTQAEEFQSRTWALMFTAELAALGLQQRNPLITSIFNASPASDTPVDAIPPAAVPVQELPEGELMEEIESMIARIPESRAFAWSERNLRALAELKQKFDAAYPDDSGKMNALLRSIRRFQIEWLEGFVQNHL